MITGGSAWKQGKWPTGPEPEPDGSVNPTPIRISWRAGVTLVVAVLPPLAFVMWKAPSVRATTVGGFASALLVVSFPVRRLSRFMLRGLAILRVLLTPSACASEPTSREPAKIDYRSSYAGRDKGASTSRCPKTSDKGGAS